jgi:hypothetical protein
MLCVFFSMVLLSTLRTTLSSVNPSLSSCFSMNVAYDLGHSIASKSTDGPNSCQEFCQVNIIKIDHCIFCNYYRWYDCVLILLTTMVQVPVF